MNGENKTDKGRKVLEAVERMKMLGLLGKVCGDFSRWQKLYYSESTSLGGILYWLDNKPEWEMEIRAFEKEYNALVYHVVHNYTENGEMLTLLYVSDEEEEWEMDREDITRNGMKSIYAYVVNLDIPFCSEIGTVGIVERAGGIVRVA